MTESWAGAGAYERYVGRWSRPVAAELVRWLQPPPGLEWIDVGCGTGALTAAILQLAAPRRVRGYDLSPEHVRGARAYVRDPRAEFAQADAAALPDPPHACDAAVSGLVLNFVPEAARALAEMRRVARPGGTVAVYVWDYAGEMQLMRIFWDAAVALDPSAAPLDEGRRFPLCRPEALRERFESAGLRDVQVRAIDVPTRFVDFDDYWTPFLGGQGPAPGYAVSLDARSRAALRERIRERLPIAADGSISLTARAWAARGTA
ncbi:MAG TPA: methyltransferase domain-containing protein [Longimicrobium sp.]|nr:methyltransferase domain-containing protein [Longimicrobium sp.]